MGSTQTVDMALLVEKLHLMNLTPDIDLTGMKLAPPEINRPALQLAGYFAHFATERVQIVGYVEYTYLQSRSDEEKLPIYEKFFSSNVPCVVYTSRTEPEPAALEMANKYKVPVFYSEKKTSNFMAAIIGWLNVQLAPRISIHGVLVDVYGEGVLIMGESGIGKSEAALELIKRGHRLVTDDVVEIHKVSDETLVGRSPEITKHFIELRGIGIVDVKTLFGVECVKETQQIDMVIKLEDWDKDKEYDRLGLTEEYTEFLGNKVVCHSLPIRPGRNLAIIVETAAFTVKFADSFLPPSFASEYALIAIFFFPFPAQCLTTAARAALSVQHGKLSAFCGRVYSRRFQLTEQRFAQIRPLSFHRSFLSRAFPLGLSFRTSVQHQDKSGSAATVDSHSPCVPAAP